MLATLENTPQSVPLQAWSRKAYVSPGVSKLMVHGSCAGVSGQVSRLNFVARLVTSFTKT